MPLLQPQFKEILSEVLPSARQIAKSEGKSSASRAKQVLDDNGLSLEDCASEMRNLLMYAEDQTLKMKVVDTALKIHGALEPEARRDTDIAIQFVFQSQDQDVGMQILIPR